MKINENEAVKNLMLASAYRAVKDYADAYQKLTLKKDTKESLHTMRECAQYLITIFGEKKGGYYIRIAQKMASQQLELNDI